MYPEPDKFIPERYIRTGDKPGAMDPRKFAFGHGKRFVLSDKMMMYSSLSFIFFFSVCAGINFAEACVFMGIVTSLATMRISKPLDADGNEVTPDFAFSGSIAR